MEKVIESNKAIILLRSAVVPVLVVTLLLPCLFMPAMAASPRPDGWYNYKDYIQSKTVSGDKTIISVTPPGDSVRIWMRPSSGGSYTSGDGELIYNVTENTRYQIIFDIFRGGNNRLWLGNIPNGTSFSISGFFDSDKGYNTQSFTFNAYLFYDGDVNGEISEHTLDGTRDNFMVSGTLEPRNYNGCYVRLVLDGISFVSSGDVRMHLDELLYAMTVQTDYLEQSDTDEIIDNLEELNKNPEEEKAEANQSGNSAVDGIVSGIPDKGKEFQTAIEQFVTSASYEGTRAVLTIPSVKMPEIPGLVPSVTLMEKTQFDFNEYLSIIPYDIVLLVRSLFTVALIIFCFKELYDTIQYVLALKGGGG